MIKAAVIGATGYAGAELVRLLLSHPQVELTGVSSQSFEGQPLSEIYPAYLGFCDRVCQSQQEALQDCDVVFAALPHGLSQELAAECDKKGMVFIDLGADFRLEKEEAYEEWYGLKFLDKDLHARSVYALPELFRQEIPGKKIIANPGCYPTSIALALSPLLKEGLIERQGIIADSKSGATGAGRGLSLTTHFTECNEAFAPYKVACHRHTPEIEQTLSKAANAPVRLTFVPHLLPVNRGIVSTCYARLLDGVTGEQVRAAFDRAYRDEYFVRVLDQGKTANLKTVQFSNFCDISIHIDTRTQTAVIVSALDNMVKGAAGQAIQNMNLVFGLEETTGLTMIPPAF